MAVRYLNTLWGFRTIAGNPRVAEVYMTRQLSFDLFMFKQKTYASETFINLKLVKISLGEAPFKIYLWWKTVAFWLVNACDIK